MLGHTLRGYQRVATLTETGVPVSAPPFPIRADLAKHGAALGMAYELKVKHYVENF